MNYSIALLMMFLALLAILLNRRNKPLLLFSCVVALTQLAQGGLKYIAFSFDGTDGKGFYFMFASWAVVNTVQIVAACIFALKYGKEHVVLFTVAAICFLSQINQLIEFINVSYFYSNDYTQVFKTGELMLFVAVIAFLIYKPISHKWCSND